MKTSITAILLLAFSASPALAQPKAEEHSAHHPASGPAASADMADGEVRKVDKGAMKLTIKHGEIKSLDMPPMTMVFQVKDAKLLAGVAVGDKVSFAADKIGDQYVVTALARKKP